MLQKLSLILIATIVLFSPASQAGKNDEVPDIREIPQLAPGLPPGTIAWALVDQLHPTQPQTGKREVKRKRKGYKDLLPKDENEFPKKLYKDLYRDDIIAPVIIAKTPSSDSRYRSQEFLGYITDRTHSSNALADMIEKRYGPKALSNPIFDEKGRPLNFVLVKVIEDHSDLSSTAFAKLMLEENHSYLRNWSRGRNGNTIIREIDFKDLPEKVYETTDNPYRSLISEAQDKGYIGRSKTDFAQFIAAEALYDSAKIEWDDIGPDASDDKYDKALKKAKNFFDSREAVGIPGANPKDVPRTCKAIFKP